MKTILLPTDFSEASEKALMFAIGIAKRSNAKILVVNAFYVPIIDINVPPSMMEELYETEEKESGKKLIQICEKISEHSSINGEKLKSEYITEQNLPIIEIADIAKEKDIDLIVMGRDSKDTFLGLLGSTTMDVLKKVKCLVLIVNQNSEFSEFKNIHYAVEDIKEDTYIKQLIPLADIFNASITIVHIDKTQKDNHVTREEREANFCFIKSLRGYASYPKINLHLFSYDDPAEGLINLENSDLLVLLKYERNWIENIFHKSVIKDVLKMGETPLLIIHGDRRGKI